MADGDFFTRRQRYTQAVCATPITATVERLANRVRVELLRGGGADWHDDMIVKFGAIWQLDETAIIASYVIVGAMARERGCYRVASAAYAVARVSLRLSAALGEHKPDPELPPDWRQHYLPIIRQKYQRDAIVRPGDLYAVPHGLSAKVYRRGFAHGS